MKWDKPAIVKKIKQLHRAGRDLSYNAMTRRFQPLLSAAAYHFGSYRAAVHKAGVDYGEVTRRPQWTRQRIIALIKRARRNDEDLHWSAVTQRGDELGRAAFAALQRRLFGSWARALHAAGLHADEVGLYRAWDRPTVAWELRERYRGGDPVNSGELQKDDPSLHAAAVRYFGAFDGALKAARINPNKVRRRRRRK
jgi:hypothetical protein